MPSSGFMTGIEEELESLLNKKENMNASQRIRGLLLDLDGVFYIGNDVLDGAQDTIRYLKRHQIPCRYVTNTTTRSHATLIHKMHDLGLSIEQHELLSAPDAALLYLRQLQNPTCHLLVSEEIKHEFREFRSSETSPDVVLIGNIGRTWTYDLLNQVFQMVMAGAELIALHKGKFWQTTEGLRMDIGAFVAGVEYVTGTEATIIGKPSPAFFALALDDLNLPKTQVMMVGDDIDSDVGGAQTYGMKGLLVRTGKYRQEYVASSSITPDGILDSIADLPHYLAASET